MISFDLTKLLEKGLKRKGYKKIGRTDIPGSKGVIYGNNNEIIVLPGLFSPNKNIPLASREIQHSFEKYLKKLQTSLEGLLGQKKMRIVFQGGGELRLPDWFTRWCETNGIEIEITPPDLRPVGIVEELMY